MKNIIIIMISSLFLIIGVSILKATEKVIVAEYTDLNNVLYVKYEGETSWTAMSNKVAANPLLMGRF